MMMLLMSTALIILSVTCVPILCKNTHNTSLDSASTDLHIFVDYTEKIVPRSDDEYQSEDYLYKDVYYDSDPDYGGRKTEKDREKQQQQMLVDQYGYSLKILANSFLVGFGVYVKSAWVMTACCLLDTQISSLHKVSVETYDSHRMKKKGGQTRTATAIKIHPKHEEEACNYDVTLLKLATPFDNQGGISIASIAPGAKPSPGSTCIVPTPFNRKIVLTKVTVLDILECKFHEDYETVLGCVENESLFCIQMKERLYGAPIICNEMLVGVLPTNMDTINNLTIIQHIASYKEWIEDTTTVRAKFRSSKASLPKFHTILIPLVSIIIRCI
ncbi:hypothetical protein Trydic_g20689 [Trypoxylus dichotomus]